MDCPQTIEPQFSDPHSAERLPLNNRSVAKDPTFKTCSINFTIKKEGYRLYAKIFDFYKFTDWLISDQPGLEIISLKLQEFNSIFLIFICTNKAHKKCKKLYIGAVRRVTN